MRHKHADVIIAWANGAIIQAGDAGTNTWEDIRTPHWNENVDYRVKPKEKVKVYRYAYKAPHGPIIVSGTYIDDSDFLEGFVNKPLWFVRLEPSMEEIEEE